MFFDIHIHLRAERVFYGKTKEGNKRRGRQESQSEGEIERGSKGGEGSLQEPICPRGGAAGSAPRTAPVFVLVQTPAPARSQAATGGAPAAFSAKPALGRKRKFTSSVWAHFTIEVINGKTKAICKYCFKKLGGELKNGTKHLHDHSNVCVKHKFYEAKSSSQKKLVVEKVSGKSQLVFKEFKQEVSRRELANFIDLHEQPLSTVEHVGFK